MGQKNLVLWSCGEQRSFYYVTVTCHESPSSLVLRGSNHCTGGYGFLSFWGLRFFLFPTLTAYRILHLNHHENEQLKAYAFPVNFALILQPYINMPNNLRFSLRTLTSCYVKYG